MKPRRFVHQHQAQQAHADSRASQVTERVVEGQSQPSSPYLNAREAVVYLRLNGLSALYYHIAENRLPTCRRGNRYLFDTRELDAWLRGFDSHLSLVRARKVR